MGVTGLWRLIEPAGKPVPVETLENKVLAVDISIWLHQVVKGYQDAKGAPLPNAHLMGLFQRLCKLLYFRIKPVFVFDGGFPELKRETIAKRQDNKSKYNSESERLKREIALLLGKKTVIGSLLGNQISPKKNKNTQPQTDSDDIFKLPELPQKEDESESDSEDEQNSSASTVDLHSVDIESDDFKNMPVKQKYDLLVELKDTRKMNSWGKLHTLPKKSNNFSDFQMQRLLKRRKVQECLQETEKEMGDVGMSLNELESFLNEEGIDTKIETLPTRRIASNNTTRFILINNVQQALADAKKRDESESSKAKETLVKDNQEVLENDLQKAITMSLECINDQRTTDSNETQVKEEFDEDLEKAIKMSLECVEEPNTSASKTDDSWSTYKSDTDNSDVCSDSDDGDRYMQPDFSTAKAYIMQYSDFTYNAIDSIVASKTKGDNKNKNKSETVNKIIEELHNDKTIIVDKVDISSGEDQQSPNVDKIRSSSSSPTLEGKPQFQDNEKISSKVIDFENKIHLQNCIDSVVDMNMSQSSVICIEKSASEVVTLDTSSDDTSKFSTFSSPSTKNLVCSVSQSESSDDEFEEVTEFSKPTVQVTLNMPNTIEDDIFADVFDVDKTNTIDCTDKLIDMNRSANVNTKMINTNESEFVKSEIKRGDSAGGDIVQNFEFNEGLNSGMKHNKQNLKDFVIPNPQESKLDEDSDKMILLTQTGSEAAKVSTKCVENPKSIETLNLMAAEIESEEQNLLQEKGRMERIGRNITEQMTKEAQELLQIFGIPYIIAPMEAEAQCAFLENVNLTDGTITDDSDIWLFGGKTVYKNFFNQKKHVLQFVSERIEKSFNLSREQLILLALLVGSDYTTGVSGVGPVTALEILGSFPFNKRQLIHESSKHGKYQQIVSGLQEFKTWVRAGKRTDNITLKKKLRNVKLGDDFPSVRVVQAYLNPNVEESKEKFTWGELNITILRDYAKTKFGWSQSKLDVILQPVIKRMHERKSQKTVHDYFKRRVDFQSLEDQMSKRVKAAVHKLDTEQESTDKNSATREESTDKPELTAGKKRRNTTKKQDDASTSTAQAKPKKKKVVDPVKICTTTVDGVEISITKTDRYQEIIPQREKDMQSILQNKLKAIELFRKTKIDRKRKPVKRRVNVPKDKAELSESSDSN